MPTQNGVPKNMSPAPINLSRCSPCAGNTTFRGSSLDSTVAQDRQRSFEHDKCYDFRSIFKRVRRKAKLERRISNEPNTCLHFDCEHENPLSLVSKLDCYTNSRRGCRCPTKRIPGSSRQRYSKRHVFGGDTPFTPVLEDQV